MIFSDYFDNVGEGIEYLIALGSIIGLLGLIIGLLGLLFMGQFQRRKLFVVIVISLILLGVCGFQTGVKYFRLH